MNARTQGIVTMIAALLVLFSVMLDARVSLILSVTFLVALAAYQFAESSENVPK
jgi:hypothetical protein